MTADSDDLGSEDGIKKRSEVRFMSCRSKLEGTLVKMEPVTGGLDCRRLILHKHLEVVESTPTKARGASTLTVSHLPIGPWQPHPFNHREPVIKHKLFQRFYYIVPVQSSF